MARQFVDILDDCLERLQRGETVEQCLVRYPEHEAELAPLLELSASLRLARKVSPRFRASTRYRLVSAIESKRPRPKVAPRVWWRRGWVIAVTVIALLLLAGGSTVAASSNSLPEQPLYPVKLAVENVRLGLTPSEMGKAKLHARFAERRFQEMVKIAQKDRPELVEKLMKRAEVHLGHVPPLVIKARRGPNGELQLFIQQLQEHRTQAEFRLSEQMQRAPPQARQALQQALMRARQSYGSALIQIQAQH